MTPVLGIFVCLFLSLGFVMFVCLFVCSFWSSLKCSLYSVLWNSITYMQSWPESLPPFPNLVLFSLAFSRDRVSLYIPGCPGTHFVDQAGLELRNPPASASWVLGLKACTTMPGWQSILLTGLVLASWLTLIYHEGNKRSIPSNFEPYWRVAYS